MDTSSRTEPPSKKRSAVRRAGSGARTQVTSPVLVVDDTEDNRDLYAMILRRLGYDVVLAIDGRDGVERARSVLPSVILMDLAMPNLDGFDATRQIRAMPELASVHIIAVTAFTDAVSVQRALAAGCDEVLTKPCPPALIGERVERASRAYMSSPKPRTATPSEA